MPSTAGIDDNKRIAIDNALHAIGGTHATLTAQQNGQAQAKRHKEVFHLARV